MPIFINKKELPQMRDSTENSSQLISLSLTNDLMIGMKEMIKTSDVKGVYFIR